MSRRQTSVGARREASSFLNGLAVAGLVLSLGFSSIAQAQTYRDRVLGSNPLFYFGLDDSDIGGSVQNLGSGTLSATFFDDGGLGTLDLGVSGLVPDEPDNKAIRFADNGAIHIPDHPDLNTGGGPWPEKTISMWIQADDVDALGKQVIYEQGGQTRGAAFYIFEGDLYFGIWNGANDDNGVSSPWISNQDPPVGQAADVGGNIYLSTPIESDTAYHVALVLDGDTDGLEGSVLAYLDGQLVGEVTGAGQLFDHGNNNAIARKRENTFYHDSTDNGGGGDPFAGVVDEWAFWNTALSQELINLHLGAVLVGDFNSDAAVNLDDYNIMLANFGTGTELTEGDTNGDGQVDLRDFLTFADAFSAAQPGSAPVPEPGSLILMTLGGLALFGYRVRRHASPIFYLLAGMLSVGLLPAESHAQTYRDRVLASNPLFLFGLDDTDVSQSVANFGSAGINATFFDDGGLGTIELGVDGLVPDEPDNKAIRFGANGSISVPDSGQINVTNGPWEEKTISFWFQAEDVFAAERQMIYEQGGQTRGASFYILDGELYFGMWNRANDDNGVSSPWVSNLDPPEGGNIYLSTPIESDTAYHVAMVFDGDPNGFDGTLSAYLNGDPVGEATGAGRLFNHGDNTALGRKRQNTFYHDNQDNAGDGNPFGGVVDEWAFWNTALSQDVIQLHLGAEFVDGDFNADGAVNLDDFNILTSNFNEPGSFAEGDNNLDGQVSMQDFLEFRAAFNTANPAAVPEPSTWALLLGGAVLLAMRRCKRRYCVHALSIMFAIGCSLLLTNSARAQLNIFEWNVQGPDTWNSADNWLDGSGIMAVPTASFFDGARINNGGAAFVEEAVPDVLRLRIDNGELEVRDGGSVSVLEDAFEPTAGTGRVQGNGTVRLSGDGTLSYDLGFTHNGRVELPSADATFDVGGDYTMGANSTLAVSINGGNAMIDVGGAATINGTVEADFGGAALNFGDKFDLINAASVSGSFANVQTGPNDPALPDGLVLESSVANGTASIEVRNRLMLTIDRATGGMSISNVVGDPIALKGYSIFSSNELLNPSGLNGLAEQNVEGWDEANLRNQQLNELNLTGSMPLNATDAVHLGSAAMTGTRPAEEDIRFRYATEDATFEGLVKYEGPVNDLVLRVDPETGDAQISNQSAFFDADLAGYSILSASGALSADNWESLSESGKAGDGWAEANPRSDAVAELNVEESQFFGTNTIINIGSPFVPGSARDLIFEVGTADGTAFFGTVEYGALADENLGGGLAADFNKDGTVDLSDFNVLKENFGAGGATMGDGDANMDGAVDLSDFNILKEQFGQSATATVPEPSTFILLALATCGIAPLLRRRR